MSTVSVRRPMSSVLQLPNVPEGFVAAINLLHITLPEFGLLFACQRDDCAHFALNPLHIRPHEQESKRRLERDKLIVYKSTTAKWELTLLGMAVLDAVFMLSPANLTGIGRAEVIKFPSSETR